MKSCISCLFLATASLLAQSDARNSLNEGIQAYRSAQYAEAIRSFQKAVEIDPSSVNARLYLATAYMTLYIPGSNSPENLAQAERAEAEFQRVLERDPNNRIAIASLASLSYQQAQAVQDPDEKIRKLDRSQDWYKKLVDVDPNNKEAYYSLGVIAWAKSYPDRMRARFRIGMRPEDPGPIANAAERQALKSKYDRVIEEGILNLEQALRIDPKYDDAMAYMNLLIRGRADLRDTPEESRMDATSADQWVQRAMEIKKQKGQSEPPSPTRSEGSSRRIRVSGEVSEQNLITRVEPVYPPPALQARIQGNVRFNVVIGKDGRVVNLQLVSGHPLLVAAATEAARQWVYKPTLLNGEPIEVVTQLDVQFRLQ